MTLKSNLTEKNLPLFYIMKIAHNKNKAGENDEEKKGSQKNDRFA